MSNLLSQDIAALKLLMNDDLYQISNEILEVKTAPEKPKLTQKIESEVEEIKPAIPTDFNYIGENNKYFLVLVDDKIHTTISSAHKDMLLKIMQAKGMELRDMAVMNIDKYYDVKFEALKSFFVCSKLVLFGIKPAQIGLPNLALNKIESFKGVKILCANSLTEMQNDVSKKRDFWNVMKSF